VAAARDRSSRSPKLYRLCVVLTRQVAVHPCSLRSVPLMADSMASATP
jgi:hypothetical protein